MAESFPASLQQTLNTASFNYVIGNTVLRTKMKVGPAKLRRILTNSTDPVQGTMDITYAEWTTFYTFFDVTVAGGSKEFLYDHPFTGVESVWRFKSEPSFIPLGNGGISFRVSFTWELVP